MLSDPYLIDSAHAKNRLWYLPQKIRLLVAGSPADACIVHAFVRIFGLKVLCVVGEFLLLLGCPLFTPRRDAQCVCEQHLLRLASRK